MFEDTYDILESLSRRSEKTVKSFRLVAPGNNSYSQFRYKLYVVSEIPSRSYFSDDDLHQLRYWVFDQAPRQVYVTSAPGITTIGDSDVLMAGAPSKLVFAIPTNTNVIEGSFGIQL